MMFLKVSRIFVPVLKHGFAGMRASDLVQQFRTVLLIVKWDDVGIVLIF